MIDWPMFQTSLRRHWSKQVELQRKCKLSISTRNCAWHGRPIGLIPFLRICRAMGAHPLMFLKAEGEE